MAASHDYNRQPVIVYGVRYPSVQDACRAHGLRTNAKAISLLKIPGSGWTYETPKPEKLNAKG